MSDRLTTNELNSVMSALVVAHTRLHQAHTAYTRESKERLNDEYSDRIALLISDIYFVMHDLAHNYDVKEEN